jgi:hypothetical protein
MTYEEWLAHTSEERLATIRRVFGDTKHFYETCVADGPIGRPESALGEVTPDKKHSGPSV